MEAKGLELSERTIIENSAVRKIMYSFFNGFKRQTKKPNGMPSKPKMLEIEHVRTAKKKINNIAATEIEYTLIEVLDHLENLEVDEIPECYLDILYEISKNTPIFGLIQSNSRTFLATLKSYLDGAVDVFQDKDILDHLNNEVPILMSMISSVRKYERVTFLPPALTRLFNNMIKLYSVGLKLASKRHIKSNIYQHPEPPLEYFPGLPLHSEAKFFDVDKDNFKDNEVTEDECNKEYPKAPKMTPGLSHVFCRHGICKGFVMMTTPETPQMFTKILTRRLPKNVKSDRRVFLYDNSCNLHKSALRRGAKEILNFKILTDRHHWKNHTGCSEAYNCDQYDYLKSVNSQICEQKNRSLRKLASTLAYCDFNNYKTKIKIFFTINNLEEKGLL